MVEIDPLVRLLDKLFGGIKGSDTRRAVDCFAEVIIDWGPTRGVNSLELTGSGDIYVLNHIIDNS